MKAFVTGAAGFIGSHLVDRLLAAGHQVIGYDNFSTGAREFLSGAARSASFQLVEGDVLDLEAVREAIEGAEVVFHMAANADVRFGHLEPRKDLEQNAIGTWTVLEAMRTRGVRRMAFASTGSVYGEPEVFPTPEDAPFPVQTSLYAASKVAAEGMMSAFALAFGIQACIFRFVSILGERYTHGHVVDFCRQLLEHPAYLHVLGDGHQRKSYLYVQDCISGILTALEKASAPVSIFNLGTDEHCEVNDSAGWISEALGVAPELTYEGGKRGWVGDSPFIFLNCSRVRALGWEPTLSIRESVVRTVRYLEQHRWVLEHR